MGKVRCSKHGTSHFVVACSHAGEQIDNGQFPTAHKFNVVQRFFVCDQCTPLIDFEECRRLDEAGEPDWREPRFDAYLAAWEAAHEALKDKRSFCSKCIEELEQKHHSRI